MDTNINEMFRSASHMGHVCVCKECLDKMGLQPDDRVKKEYIDLNGNKQQDWFYATDDCAADTVCEFGECTNVSDFIICVELKDQRG